MALTTSDLVRALLVAAERNGHVLVIENNDGASPTFRAFKHHNGASVLNTGSSLTTVKNFYGL
jgi:hypothetical protein